MLAPIRVAVALTACAALAAALAARSARPALPPSSDLSITKTAAPDPVAAGETIAYTITIANAGPGPAGSVAVTDTLPAGTTFESFTSPGGWSVTAPPVGGVGTVTAAKSTIGASAVVVFTLVVRVSVSTPAGTEIANTATVSADNDSDPGNDSATAHTTTRQPLAVALVRLTAKRRPAGVVVRWRTGAEIDVLGFALYRRGGGSGRRLRLGRRLIPALGPVSGRSYSYVDRRAPRHRVLRYWLRDVARNGRRTWHGPVRVPAA